jgi:hypothetical protein
LGDVVTVEGDRAAVGLDHAHDHSEGGGLASAVAAEDADDFFLVQNEADLVDDHAAVVRLDQLCSFEKVHAAESLSERGAVSQRTMENQGVEDDPCTCGRGVDNKVC